MYINKKNLLEALKIFKGASPFDHCVIDDLFHEDIARDLEEEFPDYSSSDWFYYKNAIENKKTINDWNKFPALTYSVFNFLISKYFRDLLSEHIGVPLYEDPGLHGGGWHIHGKNGNLNPHYDYSIHPKIGLQRKINIIIYLSSSLRPEHGGHLGLWEHDSIANTTGKLVHEVFPKFNRAVIFDTTQHSWHGMSRLLNQPDGIYRKSMAVYYLTDPPPGVDTRERALFAPRDSQKDNLSVQKLIQDRADSVNYSKVYRDDQI